MTRFIMTRIAVRQFAILAKELPTNNPLLDTEISFQYSKEVQQIACTASFTFKSDKEKLLVISCTCEFIIHPDDWKSLQQESSEINIPQSLLEILAVHTIGTTRGILYCKTEGTPFNELIIPPINVKKMIDRYEKPSVNSIQ